MKDPIVEEIHKRRAERAAAFNNDLDAMAEDLKRREAESREQAAKFVTPPKREKSKLKSST